MARWVRSLASKPDLHKPSSDFHICVVANVHAPLHTHTYTHMLTQYLERGNGYQIAVCCHSGSNNYDLPIAIHNL